jgi:IS1 family transposase
MASAIQVSTRLWLGGVIDAHRDLHLVAALVSRVRACALCRPLLFCTDGFKAYVQAIRARFREPMLCRQVGRPHLRPWDNLCIAQVIKQYAHGHVVGVVQRTMQGPAILIEALLKHTQGGGGINIAYIERLNATCRARLSALVRRGRALARQATTLQHGLYLIGTVYNFCTNHESLRVPGLIGGHKWLPRTPAMAARITDHCWTIQELLTFRVPLPPWAPPKRRGRRSNATKRLIAQWCI